MGKSLKHQFMDWVRKQPAEKRYDYWCHDCAWGQFLKYLGCSGIKVGGAYYRTDQTGELVLPEGVNSAVMHGPWTFGALLTRLEASEPGE